MQPPGSPVPFSTPFGAKTPGAGQVVSVGPMKSSMLNGALAKLLFGVLCAGSWHQPGSGGEARLTSSCSRQP